MQHSSTHVLTDGFICKLCKDKELNPNQWEEGHLIEVNFLKIPGLILNFKREKQSIAC